MIIWKKDNYRTKIIPLVAKAAEKSKLQEEIGISSHVIDLEYANAEDVSKLLSKITENVTIDKSGNRLLISASPKKISEIYDIISHVDVPALQIMLEARLIEVTLGEQEEMGFDWEKLAKKLAGELADLKHFLIG